MPYDVSWYQPSLQADATSFEVGLIATVRNDPTLASLLGTSIYEQMLPASAIGQPGLTYSIVSTTQPYSLAGSDSTKAWRVQFTASASDVTTKRRIAVALEDLFVDFSGSLSGGTYVDFTTLANQFDRVEKVQDGSDSRIYSKVLDLVFSCKR